MSKLGNVYELDFNTRMKNKYPVVYINDEYIKFLSETIISLKKIKSDPPQT